jgi:hypothetical protein
MKTAFNFMKALFLFVGFLLGIWALGFQVIELFFAILNRRAPESALTAYSDIIPHFITVIICVLFMIYFVKKIKSEFI